MKRNRILFVSTLVVVGAVVATSSAKAVTTEELLQQIQALQQQIQILQDQLKTNQSQSPVIKDGQGPPVATPSGACPAIARVLKRGHTGDDISQLQTYLAKDSSIYPEGLITGYYGSLTERAVQRWQAKQGIISSGAPETTGYGLVGPRTRAEWNSVWGCKSEPLFWAGDPFFVTPKMNEKWTIGESHTFQFSNGFPINIGATNICGGIIFSLWRRDVGREGYYGTVGQPVRYGQTSLNWDTRTVNEDICGKPAPSGNKEVVPGVYQLGYHDLDPKWIGGNYFSVVSSNGDNEPSLTILSPNGSETLKTGSSWDPVENKAIETNTIGWASKNIAYSDLYLPYLVREEDIGALKGLSFSVIPEGTESQYKYWSIPDDIPSGQYRLQMYLSGNELINDISDAPFTLQSAVPNSVGALQVTTFGYQDSVTPGSKNKQIVKIFFAAGAGEDVKISELGFRLAVFGLNPQVGSAIKQGEITNIRLLNSAGRIISTVDATPLGVNDLTKFSADLLIQSGQSQILTLVADISPSAAFKNVSVMVPQSKDFKVAGNTTNGSIFIGTDVSKTINPK